MLREHTNFPIFFAQYKKQNTAQYSDRPVFLFHYQISAALRKTKLSCTRAGTSL